MNGWSNQATWSWWTWTSNNEPEYLAIQAIVKSSTGPEDLAKKLGSRYGRETVNWIEVSEALLEINGGPNDR